MALDVTIQVAVPGAATPDEGRLRAWANAAWQAGAAQAEIVVRITDEDESRRLNHEFRGRDAPTNVLSFPFDPLPEIDLHHIGDLVICAPVVEREAHQQGKPPDAHWAHMVVHGVLHLQGYDHQTDAEAERMETLETRILEGLGFPAPYDDHETT